MGSPLVATVVASSGDATSATMIDHDCCGSSSGDRGAPPAPGERTNAIFRPSSDHTGSSSRVVFGLMYAIGRPDVNSPMKLWSPRFDTNASVLPSGDHAGD